ncbi:MULTISPECIES: [protein-PII] uridylyltransferase [Micromonospora]|uniref:Bifunctional uridylyltransferase/uridylyl-removing enzyme n=2 Tax=Micromonospora TaxID=1873 RepID=A0ABX9Y1N3_MICCH|nr:MULTISPECIES: [protein-PII] uridylyltransferase [Micromonospora]MBC8989172.1 [protein-PII] uridylyltransferase [Micromonospora chalcea]NHO79701.1 [protein-PII] uridylyltransferase [Micromonospora sp. CMU55-4]ODB78338.1 [protein-PII] uridylyltransferase [Micromonospora sp. II]RQW91427.1 [protein-PII] uridylyltransferase [Micromonospora chalcea]WDP99667.1 [protein-PII] uridylyltransferase [Micromonospora chalcea]
MTSLTTAATPTGDGVPVVNEVVGVPGGIGEPARNARAEALDAWLRRAFPDRDGVALVAVGGLGRRQCAPYGDLDLVLLHAGVPGIDELAASLWYPIWDAGLRLDHSVRTVAEALSVAQDDVKVALGLLDARHVAGDPALTDQLARTATDHWRRTAIRQLPGLREITAARWEAHGELAFLLEGDLKEAAGGLRDVGILRAIATAGVTDALRPAVYAAHRRLLDTRDALHQQVGRRVDRLVAQERDGVARLLGAEDGDALLRLVAGDARTVSHALDDAWRAADRLRSGRHRAAPGRPLRRPVARDVVEQDGELVLARTAIGARPDPSLSLRVAAAAATTRLPIARATCEWLAAYCPPLPAPWPPAARAALITLLGAGPGLVPAWETCDRYGLIDRWLPEWTRMRSLPQHNPVHRFTLDRHLVQTAYEASRHTRDVERPDLLLLGAFLHDIGKGLEGDHSTVGAPLAEAVATRVGLPPAEAELIGTLVRLHLLLPDVATRRDLSDPKTVAGVAERVGDTATLELLHALVRADAAATGPAAWSAWKGRLIAELVARVRTTLDTGVVPAPPAPDPALVAGPLPVVHLGEDRVSVAAADRRGLLATVAGCLALHRLEVISADAATVDGRALVQCRVQPRYGLAPNPIALSADLRRAVGGDVSVIQRLRGRALAARSQGAAPRVVWHREAATDAVLLELRAADAAGLLYRVTCALDEAGAQVRAARISTLGGDVVDAFYLVGGWPSDEERARIEAAVLAAV